MPSNLNALIRYKVIDSCLKNKQRKCNIEYLIDKCAEALSEYKGEETSISERTIRNDIKIMRSDVLGFNAPIVFKKDEYRYSKKNYSVFDIKFDNLDLLIEVKNLLVNDFENIKSDEKYSLLRKLAIITKEKIPKKCYHKDLDNLNIFNKKIFGLSNEKEEKETIPLLRYQDYPKTYDVITYWSWNEFKRKKKVVELKNKEYFSWEFIFNALAI